MLHPTPGERSGHHVAWSLLLAVVAVASVAAFWMAHRAGWTYALFLLLFPPVVLAAWYRGLLTALLTAALAALAANYLVLVPSGRGSTDSRHALTGFAVYFASAALVALASDNLHRRRRRERRGRLDSERDCRRAEQLQQIATAFSKARTSAAVAEACVLECTYTMGAAAGALLTIDDDHVVNVMHAVGFAPERLQPDRLQLGEGSLLTEAMRGRAPLLLSRGSRISQHADRMDAPPVSGFEAAAIVPVTGSARVSALLLLCLTRTHAWTAGDREFLEQAAIRTGQALDRTAAYDLAERARVDAESLRARADQELAERQKVEEALRNSEARYRALAARTSRLHALTAALSEALTLKAVADAVVRQGKAVAGAQAGAVVLVADNGSQFVTLTDDSTPEGSRGGQRFKAGPGLCLTEAVETRQPVFVGSFAQLQERYRRSASHAADGGFESTVALPLLSDGVPIGVLSFHFTAPVNFDDDYKALLMSVAQHCAQALDRARLYEAEHGARAVAEAANKLKDDFLSTVSHELRTPLNAILGWAAMLRTGSLDPSRTTRALQAIHDNATRQAELVDDLLDVSRIAAGRASLDVQPLDLVQTIRGAIESVLPLAAAKGLDVRPSITAPLPVNGDARRLEQVFLNLLSNAVKFTPTGGIISIEAEAKDGAAEVRVHDSGIGIEPEFLPHVFEPFRQADSDTTRAFGGLGLGLSIAKHLVDAHGGTIRVDSEGRDQGATFTVTLPIASAQQKGHPAANRPSDPVQLPDLSGVRVLVVDDEPDAREIIARALANCGTTVLTAASAHEALEVLKERSVDVLLADIGMPVEDGYALIRKVRTLPSTRQASIPAAAVTAYAREDQRQRALAAGFQLHIPKPVNPQELARAVATLVTAHSAR